MLARLLELVVLLLVIRAAWRIVGSVVAISAGSRRTTASREPSPVKLVRDVLGNVNGLAVFSCMQAVILRGAQPLQQEILEIAARYPDCTPAPL